MFIEKVKSFFKTNILVQHCDTLEAAVKQEKARRNMLLLGAAVGVLYVICAQIELLAGLAGVLMVVAAVVLVTGFITYAKANEERRRLQRVLCPKCGEKFTLENVQSTFLKERKSTGAAKDNGQRDFTVVHTYQFDCTCKKCGNVSSFNWDLIAQRGTMNNRGVVLTSRERDMQEQIAALFE